MKYCLSLVNIYFFISCIYETRVKGQAWGTWGGSALGVNPLGSECLRRIYKTCNYPTSFTEEELENVRQYLNYTFTTNADVKPDKPLCPKLRVRQDWKCLTDDQKARVISAWKQMYDFGVIQEITDKHVKFWPAYHMTAEILPSIRWLTLEFEKGMRSVDPGIALPYWDPYTYGSQPERSSIWDTLGHNGNYSNGFSVTDGIYGQIKLVPTVKRHWSETAKVVPWQTQEFMTSFIQTSHSYYDLVTNLFGIYYLPFLNIGGYEGQYSQRQAPHELVEVWDDQQSLLLFYSHSSALDTLLLKWQLKDKKSLTPLEYSTRIVKFRQTDGKMTQPDILTDKLTGFPDVSIRETFWLGFGDLCYVPDNLIKPLSNLWTKANDGVIPTALKRIPKWVMNKHFPSFIKGQFSAIHHSLEEVGECNTVCTPIPKPVFMSETPAGRRLFEVFLYDNNFDLRKTLLTGEQNQLNLWLDLTKSGYCSPYVTTYELNNS